MGAAGARDGRSGGHARVWAVVLLGSVALAAPLTAPRSAVAAPTPAAAPAQHVASTPFTTNPALLSNNWSGYFTGGAQPFTAVQGEWVQPSIVCTKPLAWTVFWVGLDGWTDGTVEQAGTSAFCPENTSEPPRYFTWWEMFPTNSIQVAPLAVAPGDAVRASVTYTPSTGKFTMTVVNKRTLRHFTQTATCAAELQCERSTAEWIAERPTLNSGQLTALADWGALPYTADKAGNTTRLTTTGKEVPVLKAVSTLPMTPVDMVGSTGDTLAAPGPLARNAFTDTWLALE